MTQEEKDLLLKDLCARLPYGVKCSIPCEPKVAIIQTIDTVYLNGCVVVNYSNTIDSHFSIEDIKPYLRPMSSMIEEEKKELLSRIYKEGERLQKWLKCGDCGIEQGKYHFNSDYQLDFCLSHHFDYRNLIDKGLALEAPEGMYNI